MVKQGKWFETTVTAKYQIVIRKVANVLDVEPGDKVEVHVYDGRVELRKAE